MVIRHVPHVHSRTNISFLQGCFAKDGNPHQLSQHSIPTNDQHPNPSQRNGINNPTTYSSHIQLHNINCHFNINNSIISITQIIIIHTHFSIYVEHQPLQTLFTHSFYIELICTQLPRTSCIFITTN